MSLQVQVIKESYALIDPRSEEFSKSFYNNLFADHPHLEPLFANTNMYEQRRKFSWSLVFVVQNSSHPDVLQSTLQGLGAHHVQYGVLPEHYPLIGSSLLRTLGEYLEEYWTSEVEQAWVEAYQAITTVMLDGANYGSEILTLPTETISEPVLLSQKTIPQPLVPLTKSVPASQTIATISNTTLQPVESGHIKPVSVLSGLLGIIGSIILIIVLL